MGEPLASVSLPSSAESIPEYVERMKKRGMQGLIDEFSIIKSEKLASTTTAYEQNLSLNRYGNIPLPDDSRVILNTDSYPNTYIHQLRRRLRAKSTVHHLPGKNLTFLGFLTIMRKNFAFQA